MAMLVYRRVFCWANLPQIAMETIGIQFFDSSKSESLKKSPSHQSLDIHISSLEGFGRLGNTQPKTNITPWKYGIPKGNDRIPTIHF